MKTDNGENFLQKYSAYYKKYKTIRDAILIVENVATTYKILHGDLLSEIDYKMAKLEDKIIPYNDSQVCCICYENTMDTTICDHHLCLKCREICILKEKHDCPICREEGIVNIYNIDNGLINNNVYKCLKEALAHERAPTRRYTPTISPFLIYAAIDRGGGDRVRSMSSESMVAPMDFADDELSEISEIMDNRSSELEESQDFIPFDLNV